MPAGSGFWATTSGIERRGHAEDGAPARHPALRRREADDSCAREGDRTASDERAEIPPQQPARESAIRSARR
jgi:hypothetical protein